MLYLLICSIDASRSSRFARFINDSPRRSANCMPKYTLLNGNPHVLIFATRDIKVGDELRYDYGLKNLPWRQVGLCTCVE